LPVLAAEGRELRVLDDFSLSSPRNLLDAPAVEFVRGDVRDEERVREAMTDVDAVIHLAAITGASKTHDIPEKTFDVNLGGTETVLRAAEEAGVERVVLASSCNVYGETYETDLDESSPTDPGNPYAESKLAAEKAYFDADVETVALRLATNYGWSPGVRFNLVVNSFVFRAVMGEPLTVYGDGRNWRPFLHVQDTARAFAAALDWPEGRYNVGEDNYRIEDIASTVADVVGTEVETDYLEDEDPGPSYSVTFDRMADQGFVPEYSLRDGVSDLSKRFDGPAN
jgi:nucleoside-diphosphate-sugar epimerase